MPWQRCGLPLSSGKPQRSQCWESTRVLDVDTRALVHGCLFPAEEGVLNRHLLGGRGSRQSCSRGCCAASGRRMSCAHPAPWGTWSHKAEPSRPGSKDLILEGSREAANSLRGLSAGQAWGRRLTHTIFVTSPNRPAMIITSKNSDYVQ